MRTSVHLILDACLFAIGFWLAHLIRSHVPIEVFGGAAVIESFEHYFTTFCLTAIVGAFLLEGQGFYNRTDLTGRSEMLWKLFKACVFAVVALIMILFLLKLQLARSVIILFGITSFALVFLKEEVVRWWAQSEYGRSQAARRVILVGGREDAEALGAECEKQLRGGVEIVARLYLDERPVDELPALLHEHSANGVILSAKHTAFGEVEKAIQLCELEGVEVWLLADFFKTTISQTALDDFLGRPVMVFRSVPETSWQMLTKQILDFMLAGVALVALSWLFLILAVIIKFTSPGPVLFRQKRCGLNGRPFMMLKFRSMVMDAEAQKESLSAQNEMSGPVFKLSNDPRVTPIGRFMRKWSLDELPQFINILVGEMSIVGPRPLPVDEVRKFDDLAHRRRLSVKPGLTCLWQISGRNKISDFRDWVKLDLEYIDNWSLWLDFKIVCLTIPAVLSGNGAK
ncbi:MAG: exopolysaccharide biosynthesis polyprenyl glycosylphosphotransferase [Verrucomicrobia bacterium]|jgi:exopolysaccharide biosynthesis polyprenyl glycosylphosphotransferase|nr:exopolysaccharide biosynthesis polyprenyl glycosylphosphotransferase [Verrucomicrobiota bacterium]